MASKGCPPCRRGRQAPASQPSLRFGWQREGMAALNKVLSLMVEVRDASPDAGGDGGPG